jgi:putative ABC transport system permease protein
VTKVALRGLAGRKLRAVLTGIAIVLGVAMISGTYILTDTVQRAFNNLLVDSYAGTDAVVAGRGIDVSIDGEQPPPPPVDASLLDVVRGVDGVALATGSVLDERNTKILSAEGEAVNSEGFPTLGFGVDTDPAYTQFNPLNILEGRWPASENEVVIDVGTADKQDFAVGDTIEISTLQPKQSFRLVGVAKYGDLDSLGAISFVVFTIPAAQQLLGREEQFDAISVAAREGVSEDDLVSTIAPVLPQSAEVVSATAEAQEQADEVSEFTSIFRYFLLAFGAIALFVGAFVIFNTFSITVAQRTREFATLRTIGASRRQILVSVILESLVIGILASLVGLGLGLVIAEGIEALFGSLGVDLPTADRVFRTRTIVVALGVGIGITLLAGLFPAIRATRVPPISAVREGATLPHGRFHRFTPWIAGLVVVGSLALLARAMFTDELGTGDRLLSIAGGVLLLFLGVAMLSSKLVKPLAAVVGAPARRLGGAAGRLAGGNSVRNPSRTAATAAALMIGIALVSFIATLTNGMKASNRVAIEEQIAADYVVTSADGYTPFVAAAGDALAASPVPEVVTSVRSDAGLVDDVSTEVGGIEPDTIAEAYVFDWQDGDDSVLADLGMTGALVSSNYA